MCSLQWSPGEDQLASGSKDGHLSVWDADIAAGKQAKLLRPPLVTMKQPSAVKVSSRRESQSVYVDVCVARIYHTFCDNLLISSAFEGADFWAWVDVLYLCPAVR